MTSNRFIPGTGSLCVREYQSKEMHRNNRTCNVVALEIFVMDGTHEYLPFFPPVFVYTAITGMGSSGAVFDLAHITYRWRA
jgi:hypothetical protein